MFRKKSSKLPEAQSPQSPPLPSKSGFLSKSFSKRSESPPVTLHHPLLGSQESVVEVGQSTELLFGYTTVATEVTLSSIQCLEVVRICCREINSRGLEVPLILSTMSLDVDSEGTRNLIRMYLSDKGSFPKEIAFCESTSVIASFLKWCLARFSNEDGKRGLVSWKNYTEWKIGEKQSSYPADYANVLLRGLPRNQSAILETLLDLFSSVSARSATNGMTPRFISGLFSPYIFGLSEDKNFDETYSEWLWFTDALEHVLLAYLRLQKIKEGRLPTHLLQFLTVYPPRRPVTGVTEVLRFRRLVRWHSTNLIAQARNWEVNSESWSLFSPSPRSSPNSFASSPSSINSSTSTLPVYSQNYRHLLNIRSGFDDSGDGEQSGKSYKSKGAADWSKFGELGFQEISAKSLSFDLTEGDRLRLKQRPLTMDWSSFSTSGFDGRETYLPQDLNFEITASDPIQAQALQSNLIALEKDLPDFNYDITVQEEGNVMIDPNFFEAWSDVLVCSGWVKEDSKESSFSLISYKSQPRDKTISLEGDGRTESRWVLVEEIIPAQYREALENHSGGKPKTSKRASFMKSVRRKNGKSLIPPPKLNVSQIPTTTPSSGIIYANTTSIPQSRDYQAIYNPQADDGETRKLKLESKANSPVQSSRVDLPMNEDDEENVTIIPMQSKNSFLSRMTSKVTPRNSGANSTAIPEKLVSLESTSSTPWVDMSNNHLPSPPTTPRATPPVELPPTLPPKSPPSPKPIERVLKSSPPIERINTALSLTSDLTRTSNTTSMISSMSSSAISSSEFDSDGYDGIEADEDGSNEPIGQVLFRGSRSYPRNLDQAQIVTGNSLRSNGGVIVTPKIILQKPEERGCSVDMPRSEDDVYSSEEEEQPKPSNLKNVRLTQFGFDQESAQRVI